MKGLIVKYKKLLDGFADDEKFWDMIPIMTHGSNTATSEAALAE
jgi:hypothetical protein